ncbi:hypothetical protein BDW74DRAFT_180347 [Aspergillus multicolor]|uniref:heme-dependent oxidative N-demethylase family protein n=1 Tax=Aspergillus multicolor TaxID=41759 RepID=UPI003CCD2677
MIEALLPTYHPANPLIPCLLLIVIGLVLNSRHAKSWTSTSLASRFTKSSTPHAPPPAPTAPETLNFAAIKPVKGLPTLTTKPNWPRYWKPGKFQMTMALRKLDINNWFNYDTLFDEEHAAKVAMVRGPNPELYVDYLDGIDEPVLELFDTVVQYVTTRFPDMFRTDGEYVYIDHLNEKYRVREPFDIHPLAVTGLLVHDDIYLLKKGVRDLYYLRGAFLACPSGWRLQQRIGWPLHQIHDPIPLWKEKLQKSMERYAVLVFTCITSPENNTNKVNMSSFFLTIKPIKPIQRNNLFIQPVPGIFHVVPFEKAPVCTSYEQVHIRTELQSLSKLPRSEAVIFTVRTYVTPLSALSTEPAHLETLWDHVRNFPEDIAEYKCRHLWNDVFEVYCREMLGKNDPDNANDGKGEVDAEMARARVGGRVCPAGF